MLSNAPKFQSQFKTSRSLKLLSLLTFQPMTSVAISYHGHVLFFVSPWAEHSRPTASAARWADAKSTSSCACGNSQQAIKKELAQVHSEPSCLFSKKHFTARNLLKKENTERPRGLTWLSNSYCDSLLREETHRWTNLFHHHLSSCKIFKTYLQ